MAPSVTNYTEIQNDEIEVLRSIYMDDFVEETPKTGAWNVRVYFLIALCSPEAMTHGGMGTEWPLRVVAGY